MKISLVSLVLILMLAGCSATTSPLQNDIIRQAENVPQNFQTEAGVSFDANSCKSPLIDPRDNTQIKFVRAERGVADYEVPSGKYGVKNKELLRVYCADGKVAGIVKR
ncbi:hypothetical protein ACW6QP_09555 [Salegentibacter sp. HM20]